MADRGADVVPHAPWSGDVSRRSFLHGTAIGAAALAGSSVLAACGSSGSSPASSTAPGGVKRGGTLRAALTGGTSTDTLDAQAGVNVVDFARNVNLYDALVSWDANAGSQLQLAEEITPNATATAWTIRLRSGLTFHNGKPVTADDVIYSFQRVANPKSPLAGAVALDPIDLASITKLDSLTLRLPCKSPYSTLVESLVGYFYELNIIPVGYDPHKPVGTGPFKYKSFTPGQQSVFVRNPDYWKQGLPYVDTLVINDFADETSQINAILSGQADVANQLSVPSISTLNNGGARTLVSDGGVWTPFTMRVDQAPFNDVRVRQAFRLAINRDEMRSLVFGGHGLLGNDIFAPYDTEYDQSIPQREQDIDQAKFLLKQAGMDGLTVTLVTSPIGPGTVSAAQVLAQQVKAAGITVNIQQVTSSDLFGANYLKWTFAQDVWSYSDYLAQVSQATLPTSPYNETHFDNPTYNKLYAAALATTNPASQTAIAHEMQQIDYTEGGYIIPYFPAVIDGFRSQVHGDVPCKTGQNLADYGFDKFWVE
jgi:peptide/nickel transport system substrate-binding protein